jgi:hypothetical protein
VARPPPPIRLREVGARVCAGHTHR